MSLVVVACEAWATVDPSLTVRYFTREPAGDAYSFTVAGGTITSSAHSSTSGNTRALFRRNVDPLAVDAEVCATWSAATHNQQPGLALRVRTAGGGTQAITVTKNIWLGGFSIFNVHLMDTSRSPVYHQTGQRDLAGLRRSASPNDVKPYPWRACARVVGTTVSFKVWPLADPEPTWADPRYAHSVAIPATWNTPGTAGLYVGHLGPTGTLRTSDITTAAL
jgi:hypothetical protein